MSAIDDSEIEEGLIVFLSNVEMRKRSDCVSKSRYASNDVEGDHSFLITAVDRKAKICIAFPMYSDLASGPSRFMLEKALKSNWPGDSADPPSYVHKRHSYTIPFDTLIAASAIDQSVKTYRRQYASPGHAHLKLLEENDRSNANAPHPMTPLTNSPSKNSN